MKIALNVSGMLTVVLENKFSSFLMQFCPFIVIIDYVLDCGNMIKKILFCFIIFLSFYIQNAYAKNIYLDNEWQYASYSVINSGYSVLYEADMVLLVEVVSMFNAIQMVLQKSLVAQQQKEKQKLMQFQVE